MPGPTLSAHLFLFSTLATLANLALGYPGGIELGAYTALGDEVAAGVGANDSWVPLNTCLQSSESYPQYLFDTVDMGIDPTKYHNQACAGAFVNDIAQCQIGDGKRMTAPDISCLSALPGNVGSPTFMTITTGQLDAGIMRAVWECVYVVCPPDDPDGCLGCLPRLQNIDKAIGIMENGSSISSLIKTAADLTQINVTNIYITGYPSFWNEEETVCPDFRLAALDSPTLDYLSIELRRTMNKQMLRLNQVIVDQAAEAGGANYVDVDQIFLGHKWCEKDGPSASWFVGFLGTGEFASNITMINGKGIPVPYEYLGASVFRPNGAGQVAYANAIRAKVSEIQDKPLDDIFELDLPDSAMQAVTLSDLISTWHDLAST